MKRKGPSVTFTIEDPNEPKEVQKLLKQIILEKLLVTAGRDAP